MNISSVFAIFMGLLITSIGLYLSSPNMGLFLDSTSIFVVLGGTIAAAATSVQTPKLLNLFKIFMKQTIRGKVVNFNDIIKELIEMSAYFSNKDKLSGKKNNIKDDFLKTCVELYLDDLGNDSWFVDLLSNRRKNMTKSLMMDVMRYKKIGKYPPAFGMMGTTMGMVVLLSELGGKDAMKTMGPAMAICLITTLYGVILANVVIVPIGENIEHAVIDIDLKNKIIVEGIDLLLKGTPPAIIAEELNSYLDEKDHFDWREVVSGV
jgi:chemotaxis protein MotA